MMQHPVAGGRYVRDPKTGILMKADETAHVVQEAHLTEQSEPETEVAPVTTVKKGK